jgi:hypothetical protein
VSEISAAREGRVERARKPNSKEIADRSPFIRR